MGSEMCIRDSVRARANGSGGARGSSRGGGGEDADQIMQYEMKGGHGAGHRSGSANRRAGASAAAYQAQSLGMGASDALKAGAAANHKSSGSGNNRSSQRPAAQHESVFEFTDSLMEKLGTPEMLL